MDEKTTDWKTLYEDEVIAHKQTRRDLNSLYENEVIAHKQTRRDLDEWERVHHPAAMKSLANKFEAFIKLHVDGLTGYLILEADHEAGLI